MHYLWNTGRQAAKLVEKMAEETGLPVFAVDHPMPQQHATREGYDEGVCLLHDLIAVCSERPLDKREYDRASKWWTS